MDELTIRNIIISKARKKYIPSHTMNISIALQLYLKKDALEGEQIPLQVSTNNRPKNWVDTAGRPMCPECKKLLLLNQNENKWVCSKCGYERKNKARLCPECQTPMNLFPVNIRPGDQTGDNSKSQWMCPKCWYDEYSTKTVVEWFKERNK